ASGRLATAGARVRSWLGLNWGCTCDESGWTRNVRYVDLYPIDIIDEYSGNKQGLNAIHNAC
ncbi:hypothetical protein, partial [Phenylobacterium sp.]|uniref:hypothetical protein n=1 Tax=Phenylobacterium sp. TaxID=1871053 RepID=UPI0037CBEF4B